MAGLFTGHAQLTTALQDVANLQNTYANTKRSMVDAQQKTMALQREQMLLQRLSALPQGETPKSTQEMSSRLLQMAGVYADAGLVNEAAGITDKVASMNKRDIDASTSQSKAAIAYLELQARLHPEDRSLQEASMSAKDRYEKDRQAKNDQYANAERAARTRLISEQVKLSKAREEKLKKEGTKSAPKEDVKYADDLIATNFPIMDDKERDLYARQIAERATILRGANPNLSKTEASAQAYAEMEKAGTFKNFIHKKPTLSSEQKEQEKMVTEWGGKYDPALEYKIIDDQLMSRPRQ